MDVYELGEGEPEVAVVGAIHGDEPCGADAVRRLLDSGLDVERPVRLIVANEAALDAGERYLETDLNRAFPGDPDADAHEERLAAELLAAVEGCTTLAIHSTQSFAEPFAVIDSVDEVARAVAPHLPVDVVIQTDAFTEGRLIEHPHTLEVEAGLQGSEGAADNAYWLTRAFLTATGALPAPGADGVVDAGGRDDVEVFRLRGRIPKPEAEEYEVFARNFERVDAGERFAAATRCSRATSNASTRGSDSPPPTASRSTPTSPSIPCCCRRTATATSSATSPTGSERSSDRDRRSESPYSTSSIVSSPFGTTQMNAPGSSPSFRYQCSTPAGTRSASPGETACSSAPIPTTYSPASTYCSCSTAFV